MKTFSIIFFLSFILSAGCKEASSGRSDSPVCNLSGRFFNRTVLDNCLTQTPSDIPYYALELAFDGSDSVFVFNGIEKYKLPYVPSGEKCKYIIKGATQSGDMAFQLAGDSTIQLTDSAWTDVVRASIFAKTINENRVDWDFDNFYNECVIAGSYMYHKVGEKASQAYLLPNGQVTGIKPFLSFSLCYAGDCLEETLEQSRLIEFTDDRGERHLFSFKMPEGKSRIEFFSIGDPKPDIKGERSIGPLSFELKEYAAAE
jgi:hypothetical protein